VFTFGETLIFDRVLSPYERQQVREYIQARYGIAAPVWSPEDRAILQLNPYSWVRADYYAEVAGKVSAFLDKVRPGHSMAQGTAANQVVTPTPDAAFNGQLSARFVGGQQYNSSLATSAWKFWHDGSGSGLFLPYMATTGAGTDVMLSTRTGSTGAQLYRTPAGLALYAANGATAVINVTPAIGGAVSSPTYLNARYRAASTPNYALLLRATSIASGAQLAAPAIADPQNTLRFGSDGANFSRSNIPELIFFDRELQPAERAVVQQYMARYGL
jgi:hypothetical protein